MMQETELYQAFHLPFPIKVTKTAAYAAVAASRFSGFISANSATANANTNIDAETTPSARGVAVAEPTTKISIGTTIISPPDMANPNRCTVSLICARRRWLASSCSRPVPRLSPSAVLCCISEGLKEPRTSVSRNRLRWDAGASRPRSVMRAFWIREPGPESRREAAMSLTKWVSQRLAWMNSKSRRALAMC